MCKVVSLGACMCKSRGRRLVNNSEETGGIFKHNDNGEDGEKKTH